MTEHDQNKNDVAPLKLAPVRLELHSEEELDATLTNAYDGAMGDTPDAEAKEYFFSTLVPQLKEVYGSSYSRAASRGLRIIENGSIVSSTKVADYFRRAIKPEEVSFARLPKEKIKQIEEDVIRAISNSIASLRKKYGPEAKLVDAVILYGSFANKTFTYQSDVNVVYVTATGEKSEYVDGEYVDAEAELNQLLAERTGRDIEEFLGIFDLSNLTMMLQQTVDDGLLSDQLVVVSPDVSLKAHLSGLLQKKAA